MNPTVAAAWIAARVSVLTLIGTLAAQYFGRRGTKDDTEKAFAEQRSQLNETLKAQREHLDRTLDAQNQQLDRTLAEQRTRTLNERFATAAEQLGSDKPAVQLAGVYAMAGLADDWEENAQVCVDVLCAYLRIPYEPDPVQDAPPPERLAFQASREVRHTVIRVVSAHLKKDAATSWQGLNFDFTGVVFDGGSFAEVLFSGGKVSFDHAQFSGGSIIHFLFARFTGGKALCSAAKFFGGTVDFGSAQFSGGEVHFNTALFAGGEVKFEGTQFISSEVNFNRAFFPDGIVSFNHAVFSGGTVDLSKPRKWSSPLNSLGQGRRLQV